MLPSICRHSCRLGRMQPHALRRTAAFATRGAARAPQPAKSPTLRLASRPVTMPSTTPYKAPKQKPYAPGDHTPILSHVLIYHIGQPRIYMLGGLKVTALVIFGFIVAAVLPTYLEPEVPPWKAPLVLVAATIPVLAIWALTYPMVMWMHIRVPKEIQRSKALLDKFLAKPAADMGVWITTMGPVGKPRVTFVKLADLKPARQRGGLVNHVRDVTRENQERKWYQFRAISKFLIQNEHDAKASARTLPKRQQRPEWTWYSLIKAFRQRHGTGAR